MADIQVESNTRTIFDARAHQAGPVWTSALIAYAFIIEGGDDDFEYTKTIDGGLNWAAPVKIKTGVVAHLAVYYEKWTDGDDGTPGLIYMTYMDTVANDAFFRTLDTNGDTLGTERVIFNGAAVDDQGLMTHRSLSVIKTLGGEAVVAYRLGNTTEHGIAISASPGADDWTIQASDDPHETTDDMLLLTPANAGSADTSDFGIIYWDLSASELTYKTFDVSATAGSKIVSEDLISDSMALSTQAWNFGVAFRQSDGFCLLGAWDLEDSASANLKFWHINGGSSITAKNNVYTNSPESVHVSVFIDQQTDDTYVTIVRGTAWKSLTKVFYKKAPAGGDTWGSEQAMSVDAEDDIRVAWSGNGTGTDGGRFGPVWVNDDLNDLFFNDDNAVTLAAPVAGGGNPWYHHHSNAA